jgi:hypothetical protein
LPRKLLEKQLTSDLTSNRVIKDAIALNSYYLSLISWGSSVR